MQLELHTLDDKDLKSSKKRLKNHKLALTCVCIDSKDQHAYTGSKDGSIIKWCLKTRKILCRVDSNSIKTCRPTTKTQQKFHSRHINCLAIDSDDKFLASGGWDKLIIIHSPDNLSWIHTFSLHKQEITALSFRLGHPTLYSASADRSIMLWTLEDDDNRCFVESFYGHESPITCLDSLRKERILSSGGRDQSIRIWKIVEQAQTVFESKHESVDVVKFIDDKTFVSGGEDGSIIVWTTMKRSPVCQVKQAHRPSKDVRVDMGRFDEKGYSFWISALAKYSCNETLELKTIKKRKLMDGEDEDEPVIDQKDEIGSESDQDDEDQEEIGDEIGAITTITALIASGSCNSEILVWKLIKTGSRYELKLHQTIECVGFVNDLRFTKDGKKLIAACGQDHKFGRWWRMKNAKNCMRIFEVNKL